MSLFKDITDELEQAVNDIEVEQTEEDEDLFAIISEGDDVEVDQDLLNSMLEDEELTEETAADIEPTEEAPAVLAPVEETPAVKEEPKRELSEEEKNAVTVITKGTTINGSIISDCSLDVMGTINGDIECLGKLTISGKVTGTPSLLKSLLTQTV
jgi:hypothetical protein